MLGAVIIFNMTFSLKENEESLAVGTYCNELGTALLFARGVYFQAKNLLK